MRNIDLRSQLPLATPEGSKAAGVENLRMYDLRHLSAQFAGDMGATDRHLMIHLGHSNPKMSHRYSRRPVARRVATAIGDALLGDRLLRVVS